MAQADLQQLQLTTQALQAVRDALEAGIREGLSRDGAEIRALPAFLPPPPRGQAGSAIVVDVGGTNMRAAWVELMGRGETKIVAGPVQEKLDVRGRNVDRETFFDEQAALVKALGAPPNLPVGYCFSYPSQVEPSRDARLIRWTKGIDIPGVEGTHVGKGLEEALVRAGVETQRVTVLNDTVAAMLAATRVHATETSHDVVGLIVGTGTNMAMFADAADAPKLQALGWSKPMAVNLESGNFCPPHLSRFDDALDAKMGRPGEQRFEKAVSGFYLPYLYEEIRGPSADFSPEVGTAALVEQIEARGEGAEVATLLLARSADLVAAALAAVLAFHGERPVSILAEGSTFWRSPGYADRVRRTLEALGTAGPRAELVRLAEANLIGSACAALLDDKQA